MTWFAMIVVVFFAAGFGLTLVLRRWGLTGTSYPDQWSEKNRP
jgi:hypothetical protein